MNENAPDLYTSGKSKHFISKMGEHMYKIEEKVEKGVVRTLTKRTKK